MLIKEYKIPLTFHLLYLLLSVVICYLYYKKIVERVDWNALNSINQVQTFHTMKPYQFRLLIPFIFFLFKPLYSLIGNKTVYILYNVAIVYFIVIAYYKLLTEHILNKKAILYLSPIILYPILWNYIILNASFQYYDFTAILIYTIGLYYIVREDFNKLLIVFIIGLINKETIAYLIFAYIFFNYRVIFNRKIILNTLLLSVLFISYKLFLSYIFWNNAGDSFEIGFAVNVEIIKNLPFNRIYQKNLLLNFGPLYVFIFLFLIGRRWRKYPDKRKVFMNLAFIPYILAGIYITYFTEVRVYTELIPMITTLFVIYLSTFTKLNLQPVGEDG